MRTEIRCRECGKIFAAEVVRDQFSGVCPRCLAGFALDEATQLDERPPLKPGATFRGMEVLEILGHGGMGVVYKARQVDLDRPVALKLLSPKLAGDPEFAQRFNREAKVLASLNHPHIVHIYEFGKEGDLYFLAMEFVDGVSLRGLLRERKLEAKEALAIVPQICEALEYAHAQGVVHRDIKPENILVDRAGKVKIADFGLAKAIDRESATRTNVVMGTPHYMAPEQYESTKSVDHRADIYSLGVVFYEMLTGEVPMGRFEPPSKRVQVDVRLDEVVLKTLERQPERRYQRAQLVKSDVETIVTTPPAVKGTPKPPRSEKIALACLGLFLGSLAGQFFIQNRLGSLVDGALATATGLGILGSLLFMVISILARLRYNGRWLAGTGYAVFVLLSSLLFLLYSTLRGATWTIGSKTWRLHPVTNPRPSSTVPESTHQDSETPWSLLRTLSPHAGVTLAFALSPDEGRVATLGDDDSVCIWDARTGRELARLPHGLPSNWTRTLEFSPDSKRLAVGGGKTALLFDCSTWKRIDEWTLEDGCASFRFAGDAVLVRGLNGTLAIRRAGQTVAYSGDTARIKESLPLGDRLVLLRSGGLSYKRDKAWLVAEVARMDRTEVLSSARLDREGPSGSGASFFQHAQLFPDGKSMLYVDEGKVVVHEIESNHELRRFADGIEAAGLSPDGARLAVCRNGKTEIWDPAKGELLSTLAQRSAESFLWSPAGDRLVVQGRASVLLNAENGRELFSAAARKASFSGDGRTACLWEPEGTVHIVDAAVGTEFATRQVKSTYFYCATYPAPCALSSKGTRFAALVDGSLALYDLVGRREGPAGRGHAATVDTLRLTPDSKHLVTFSPGQGEAKIVEVDSGRETFAIPTGTWEEPLKLSPDGRFILTRSHEGVWRVSSVPGGWKTLEIESRGCDELAFTGDGRFAVARQRETLRCVDLKDGKEQKIEGVRSFLPSPTDSRLAVGRRDGVSVMDLAGDKSLSLVAEGRPFRFSDDGSFLLVGGEDALTGIVNVSKRTLTRIPSSVLPAMGMAVDRTGKFLALADCNRGGSLIEVGTGRAIAHERRIGGHFVGARFSPDGQRLLLYNEELEGAFLYDTSGTRIAEFSRPIFAFDAQSRLFVARGTTVEVWLPQGREATATLDAGQPVDALACSADGRRIAAAIGPRVVVWQRTE